MRRAKHGAGPWGRGQMRNRCRFAPTAGAGPFAGAGLVRAVASNATGSEGGPVSPGRLGNATPLKTALMHRGFARPRRFGPIPGVPERPGATGPGPSPISRPVPRLGMAPRARNTAPRPVAQLREPEATGVPVLLRVFGNGPVRGVRRTLPQRRLSHLLPLLSGLSRSGLDRLVTESRHTGGAAGGFAP